MHPRELITTTSLADEIAFRLQAAILDGSYAPGAHLLQDELCERFGVSRTPIREALRKLQALHLVELIPNRGAMVRVPRRDELIDVYVVRAELEGFACELAAGEVDAAIVAELDRAQAEIDDAIARYEAGEIDTEAEAAFNKQVSGSNDQFHGIIHGAAGNQRLRAIIGDLQTFFPKDYVWRAIRSSDEMHALHIDDHRTIREKLAAHDARAARRAMSTHIIRASSLLVAYLDEHNFWK